MISLRASRVNADLSLREVSALTGYSEKTISSWERGHTAISAAVFDKLCDLYKIDKNLVAVPIVEDGCYDE